MGIVCLKANYKWNLSTALWGCSLRSMDSPTA